MDTTRREPSELTAREGMVWIPGGVFDMGSDRHYPEEAPVHRVGLEGFWIDAHPVTNAQFAVFASETGYVTLAERPPNPADYPGILPEMLYAGSLVFTRPAGPVDLADWTQWWAFLAGANWRYPYGPGTSTEGLLDHPVVHVAFEDALAYARWTGKEVPSEAQFEFAARGGLDGADFAWGDELAPDGRMLANYWQGDFPQQNLVLDGYQGTSPVTAFPANGYGVSDMIGNVWEWTSDWFSSGHQVDNAKSCCSPSTPRGGSEEDSYDPMESRIRIPRKVLKGGSHLCAANYCARYRPAARLAQPVDTSTCHVGFRCVSLTTTES